MASRMTAPQASDADRPPFADASEAGIFAQIRADARRNVARFALQGFASPQAAAAIGALIGDLAITDAGPDVA